MTNEEWARVDELKFRVMQLTASVERVMQLANSVEGAQEEIEHLRCDCTASKNLVEAINVDLDVTRKIVSGLMRELGGHIYKITLKGGQEYYVRAKDAESAKCKFINLYEDALKFKVIAVEEVKW